MRLLVILIPLFLSCHVRGQQQGPDVVNPGDGSGGEVQASEETERDDPIGWVLWENEASSEPKFVPTTPFTHAAIGAASGPKIYVIRKNESTTRDNFISFLTNVSSLLSSSSALFLPPLQGYFPHEKFEDQWCGDSACSTYYECRAIYGPVFSCLRNANYLKAKNGGASDQEAFSFLYDYHPVLCNDSQVAGLRARCPVLIAEGKNGGFIDPFDEPNSENSVPQRGSVNESSFSGEGQDHVPNAPSIVSYGSPATIDVQNPGNTSLSAKEYYLLSVPNWHDAHTDENVQAIIEGGGDTDGLWWDALNFTTDGFVYTLQEALLNEKRLNCSPATPGCNQGLINCADVGARNIPNFEGTIYSRWGFFVLSALQNIALRLQTQFQAINIATVNSTLKVFDIDGYYPIPGKQLGLKDIFSGLGVVFGVLSGFTPVLGPGLGQAGTMLGAVGYYLEKSIKPIATGSATQANFANVISSIYTQLLGGTEQFAIDLFNGKSIEDRNITDMMMNGTWVNRNAFQSLTDASGKMSREIISRSLNALWKISPRNKMWVLFVDLQDDPANPQKCIIDDTGPAESKWCADGGVYYTYNFIEENGNGYVWRPWGPWVNGTASDLGLDLKYITAGSALSYQFAKKRSDSFDAFNLTGNENITQSFIEDIVQTDGFIDIAELAGRYPGTWTLPVCNASTWGKDWNYDYTGTNPKEVTSLVFGHVFDKSGPWTTHPPCLCGEGGLETANFAKAAGLLGFDLFYDKCKAALQSKDFAWPAGVTSVSYGFREPIFKP